MCDKEKPSTADPQGQVRLGATAVNAPEPTPLGVRALAHSQGEALRLLARAVVGRAAGKT